MLIQFESPDVSAVLLHRNTPHGYEPGEATVQWEADIEAREWGVKGVTLHPRRVRVLYQTDDTVIEEEIVIDVDGWKAATRMCRTSMDDFLLYPQEVVIDYANRTIDIDFIS